VGQFRLQAVHGASRDGQVLAGAVGQHHQCPPSARLVRFAAQMSASLQVVDDPVRGLLGHSQPFGQFTAGGTPVAQSLEGEAVDRAEAGVARVGTAEVPGRDGRVRLLWAE